MSAPLLLDGLLCHCRVHPDGHVPGDVLDCEALPVKANTYSRPADERGGVGARRWFRSRTGFVEYGATGTCPECGQVGVKVSRVTHRVVAGHPELSPGAILGVSIQLAAHRVPVRRGGPCSAAGREPAEGRFTLPLWRYVDDFGPDHIEPAPPAAEVAHRLASRASAA